MECAAKNDITGCSTVSQLYFFHGLNYCSKHYKRVRAHGNPYKQNASRKWMACWKIYLRQYNIVNVDGIWRPEHIVVAEDLLGRKLKKGQLVHHVNGFKKDNEPSNLVVMTRKRHTRDFWKLHPWLRGN